MKNLKKILNDAGVKLRYIMLFERPTPPILTGTLRASDWHHVEGNKLYVGHNVPYARKLHEGKSVDSEKERERYKGRFDFVWVKGKVSKQAGDVGDHWISSKIPKVQEFISKRLKDDIVIDIIQEFKN
jgi:hypothetical protein